MRSGTIVRNSRRSLASDRAAHRGRPRWRRRESLGSFFCLFVCFTVLIDNSPFAFHFHRLGRVLQVAEQNPRIEAALGGAFCAPKSDMIELLFLYIVNNAVRSFRPVCIVQMRRVPKSSNCRHYPMRASWRARRRSSPRAIATAPRPPTARCRGRHVSIARASSGTAAATAHDSSRSDSKRRRYAFAIAAHCSRHRPVARATSAMRPYKITMTSVPVRARFDRLPNEFSVSSLAAARSAMVACEWRVRESDQVTLNHSAGGQRTGECRNACGLQGRGDLRSNSL